MQCRKAPHIPISVIMRVIAKGTFIITNGAQPPLIPSAALDIPTFLFPRIHTHDNSGWDECY